MLGPCIECSLKEACSIVGNAIIFASGNPFKNVDLGSSSNFNEESNIIGLGTLLSGDRIISSGMLQSAVAAALLQEHIEADLAEGYREMYTTKFQRPNKEEILLHVDHNTWNDVCVISQMQQTP